MARRARSQAQKIKGIYRRGNIFWYSRMENGRRVQVTLGTDDFGEAVHSMLQVRGAPFLNQSDPLEQEITDFIAHKLRQNEYSRDSASTKRHILLEFAKFINSRDPAAIVTADVERFYRKLQERVSESTAQGYLTTLKSFFNSLVDTRKVRSNPVLGVRVARLDQKGRALFCDPELRDKLINECCREDLKFVLFCGFHAGMRKQEIVEAHPDWFQLGANRLEIDATPTFRPKGRKARTLPLTKSFRDFLSSYGMRSPFMLHPEIQSGAWRYRYDFRRPWEQYMEKQKCEWVTPHVMRHTFASLLASAGVSIFKIAQWLGDDVRVVQKHYAKLLPKDEDIEKAFPVIET
jgi:integrase